MMKNKDFEEFRVFIDSELMSMAIQDAFKANINIDVSQKDLITAISTLNVAFTMKVFEEYHKWLHSEIQEDIL